MQETARATKWVVAHMGRRDNYQLALALHEAGMLEKLVTETYFPFDRLGFAQLYKIYGSRLPFRIRARFKEGLPSSKVVTLWSVAIKNELSETWRTTQADDRLGHMAGCLACKTHAGIMTYASYAPAAFDACVKDDTPRIVFHYSAHPRSVQKILRHENTRGPNDVSMIDCESEMNLTDSDIDRYDYATRMADLVIAPSTFVRGTLIEQGCSTKIAVLPYGVDTEFFTPAYEVPASRFRVLFVGRLSFRKGVWPLLEAWRQANLRNAELILVGKIDSAITNWLHTYDGLYQHIPHISHDMLRALYQSAHLLCIPSYAEGLSLTILESLACATPVLSTPNSGASDILHQGKDGYLVEVGDIPGLVECLKYCSDNRDELISMRVEARRTAEQHTWQNFRRRLVQQLLEMPIR